MLYENLITKNLEVEKPILFFPRENRELRYRELHEQVVTMAGHMVEHGVRAYDRVIIRNNNESDAVIALLACVYLGACFVPVQDKVDAQRFRYIVKDASPSMVIGTPDGVAFKQLTDSCPQTVCEWNEEGVNRPVYIIYTSGSTGAPKGVLALESSVAFCIDRINQRIKNSSEDRILCSLPLSFDYGLYQLFMALQYRAVLVVLPAAPLIQSVAKALVQYKITGFPAMPALLSLLIKTGLLKRCAGSSCLRYVTSTGDHLPVDLIMAMHELFPSTSIIPMYGLTECKRVAIMPPDRWDKIQAGSCGLPLAGTTVTIDQPDEKGYGELIVTGTNVMEGYWNDPEETAKDFFLNESGQRSLRTGDLFALDEEGFLYYKGRIKRILKVGGYRVGKVELETRLQPFLEELADEWRIVGIPNDEGGDRIGLCVSTTGLEELIMQTITVAMRNWSPWERISVVYTSNEPFPRTMNGKIDEVSLQERVMHYGIPLA